MNSSFWFDTITLGWSFVCIEGSQVIIFKYNCISFSEDVFVLACSVDLNEMLQYAAFHLGVFSVCQSTHLGVTSLQIKGKLFEPQNQITCTQMEKVYKQTN